MQTSKTYTILLLPDKEMIRKIQDFRLKYIGTNQVDNIPYPHITLKRKFCLNEGFKELDLIEFFRGCNFTPLNFHFKSIETYGDALVLTGESDAIRKIYENVLNVIGDKIVTINPQHEGKNNEIHLTLFRLTDSDINLSEIILDARNLLRTCKGESVVLAEYGKNRDFYKELSSIKL